MPNAAGYRDQPLPAAFPLSDERFVLPRGRLLDMERVGGVHVFRAGIPGRLVAIPALVESGAGASNDVGQRMRPRWP